MTRSLGVLRRTSRVALLLAATTFGLACAPSALAPDGPSEVRYYRGEQRLPVVLQLEGELTLTRQDDVRFEGTIDLRRTDAAGRVERLAGLVRGRYTTTTIDFEVSLDGGVMRHVGRLEGARHVGTWLDDGGLGGSLVSGSFALERAP